MFCYIGIVRQMKHKSATKSILSILLKAIPIVFLAMVGVFIVKAHLLAQNAALRNERILKILLK